MVEEKDGREIRVRVEGQLVFKSPLEVPGFDVIAVWHPRLDKDPAHRWLRNRLAATAQIGRREHRKD
jgi:hypothetical protein